MLLNGRYELVEPIGRGGMATVYRGRDVREQHMVALKILREVYSTDPEKVANFQQSAEMMMKIEHPNIVQVYDYGRSDATYYIVMEWIEGTDLRRYLQSRDVLHADRMLIIAHDVALGLGAAHRRNVVHRAVKPQKILIGRDGSVKITGFVPPSGASLGTVHYYAPEQAQEENVTPAVDMYALGIVMYQMLTGRTPFDGETPVEVAMQHIHAAPIPPSQYNPTIPPALEDIILNCLEKKPEKRYQNGTMLAQALQAFTEEAGMLS